MICKELRLYSFIRGFKTKVRFLATKQAFPGMQLNARNISKIFVRKCVLVSYVTFFCPVSCPTLRNCSKVLVTVLRKDFASEPHHWLCPWTLLGARLQTIPSSPCVSPPNRKQASPMLLLLGNCFIEIQLLVFVCCVLMLFRCTMDCAVVE